MLGLVKESELHEAITRAETVERERDAAKLELATAQTEIATLQAQLDTQAEQIAALQAQQAEGADGLVTAEWLARQPAVGRSGMLLRKRGVEYLQAQEQKAEQERTRNRRLAGAEHAS